jgi:predicted metalloprotease with PDZ domain
METALRRQALCLVVLLGLTAPAAGQARPDPVAFTVSTPDPASHLYHVVLQCPALPGDTTEFRMPVWTPGYYGTFDYAGNVRNFGAADGQGRSLAWEKSGANAWTVRKGSSRVVAVSYDVSATSPFVANAYLDEHRGYITPGAVFMYVPGQLRRPVTVTIDLYPAWSGIATGLDAAAPDRPRTFAAADFDVLYDSPILLGTLESLPPFEIQGVPHYFIGYNLGQFDRRQFMSDLKAVVEAGVRIIGEVPYTHYTFMAIGPGQGGIEHLNSTAFGFNGLGKDDRAARTRELAFLAHEYFHHFNVKRIRPIALGPFDYDRANPTRMLWVSEGFTVYYEYLMLARSGRMTREELLDALRRTITAQEDNPGRLFQSATESSYETWSQGPFGRGKQAGVRKTISYYDKGAILGMLLDFAIRHATGNQKSLDTVMRLLYTRYYKQLGRGWTDEEFRQACESVGGVGLGEVFEYASTTKEVDYAKYLAYAGLELEPRRELPDAYLGAIVEDLGGGLTVAAVEGGSPATAAGVKARDVIAAVDGAKVDAAGLDAAVAARMPGGTATLTIVRDGAARDVTVTLGHKLERSFAIRPVATPDALQAAILASWSAGSAGSGLPSAHRER